MYIDILSERKKNWEKKDLFEYFGARQRPQRGKEENILAEKGGKIFFEFFFRKNF